MERTYLLHKQRSGSSSEELDNMCDEKTQNEENGLFELSPYGKLLLLDSAYYNKDLAPTELSERSWGVYHIANLWIGMAITIPTYMLAAGLIAEGMKWWQALLTIGIANFIILIPIQLNSHAGTKYGIPYPIFARLSFGILGSHFPSIIRALVAAGWFGIQCWIGGAALNQLIGSMFHSWAVWEMGIWISFFSFWFLNLIIAYIGSEGVKFLEVLGVPILLLLCLALMLWSYISVLSMGKGISDILNIPPPPNSAPFYSTFFLAITANIGFWAAMSLNIPDFSRYAKNQRAQFLGQLIALPTSMTCIAFVGVFVTGSSYVIYGEYLWDPISVIDKIHSPIAAALGALGVVVATLTTNIAANIVAPANGISNIYPKYTTYSMGVVITCLAGIAIMPWKLLSSSSVFIFGWLATYSIFLGPLAGIFIADYYIYRHKNIELISLFRREHSLYWYRNGVNIWAFVTWIFSCTLPLIGKLFPLGFFGYFWESGWIIGFITAIILYPILMVTFGGRGSLIII